MKPIRWGLATWIGVGIFLLIVVSLAIGHSFAVMIFLWLCTAFMFTIVIKISQWIERRKDK